MIKKLTPKTSYIEEISQFFTQVFTNSEGQEEGELIGQLVDAIIHQKAEEDFFGFVMMEENQIIGCILFTRLTFENGIDAFLLSPVAIDTKHQGTGIGQNLIRHGLEHLKKKRISLAFTYGDPNFYSKTGFHQISEELIKAPFELSQPEGWLAQSLKNKKLESISGKATCVKAFNNPEIW